MEQGNVHGLNCYQDMTSFWVGRPAKAIAAAFSRPTQLTLITNEAAKVGRRLAKEGVIGRFALDFVVVRAKNGKWEPYAIEINLRKGGTTHPFLTLQFLTDGTYNPETGIFTPPNGQQKFLEGTT